jgi:DNA helicase-2/ATP-dependent DNA helicase PcrA
VLGLADRLPGLRRVDLETNHRCAPEVVRRAARLVEHNQERFSKRIRASPTAEGSVTLLPDSGDEVARARLLLASWGRASGAPAGSRAVLARTNAELVPYAAVALELGIPCRVEEDGLLLDEPEVLETLERAIARFGPGAPPLPALASTLREVGLGAELGGSLLAWAAPFRDLGTFRGGMAARSAARRALAEAAREGGDGVVTLATFHSTKGLEWDHVACIGHDAGTFPSARALEESLEPVRTLEEERRLAYVAWTRARRTLTIVYDPGAPSRFLREAFDAEELA